MNRSAILLFLLFSLIPFSLRAGQSTLGVQETKPAFTLGFWGGFLLPQGERRVAPHGELSGGIRFPDKGAGGTTRLIFQTGVRLGYEPLKMETNLSSPQVPTPEPVTLRGSLFFLPELFAGIELAYPRPWLNPFLTITIPFALVTARSESFGKSDRVQEWDPGVGVRLGNGFRLGPGKVALSLGYAYIPARSEILGKNKNLQGGMLAVGYEWILKK